jgi:hypothetical protein
MASRRVGGADTDMNPQCPARATPRGTTRGTRNAYAADSFCVEGSLPRDKHTRDRNAAPQRSTAA